MPYTIFEAVRLGGIYLSWEENLEEDERPPRSIWADGMRLKEWFDVVKKKRTEKWSGKGKPEIDDPMENEAAKGLIVGHG